MDLTQIETPALLTLFADILDELWRRSVCRSTNNPVADYSEYLVCRALDLTLAPKSTTGYDAQDDAGVRFEIKARRPTRHNPSRQLSQIRGLEHKHFNYLAGVLFNEDFTVLRACLIPWERVKEVAAYRQHTNSYTVYLTDSLWNTEGVVDITGKLRQVASQLPLLASLVECLLDERP